MKLLKAHRVRIYPHPGPAHAAPEDRRLRPLRLQLALEQRSTFGRRGRKISFTTWTAELKALKVEVGRNFLDLPKLGKVRMIAHRPIQGRVRTASTSWP